MENQKIFEISEEAQKEFEEKEDEIFMDFITSSYLSNALATGEPIQLEKVKQDIKILIDKLTAAFYNKNMVNMNQ